MLVAYFFSPTKYVTYNVTLMHVFQLYVHVTYIFKFVGAKLNALVLMAELYWSESESDIAWNGYLDFLVVCLH